jgi:hypothetical protein
MRTCLARGPFAATLALIPALAVLVPLLGAQCFPRQCNGPENCDRICECVDASRNETFVCPARFQCDVQNNVCADDYNSSCQEICDRFFANGLCGSQGCEGNQQCIRDAECALVDGEGALICQYTCSRTFECLADSNVCEAGFALDDATICALPECANLAPQIPDCAPAFQ